MKLPRDVDAAELIKALSRLGYRVVRQMGTIFACDATRLSKASPFRIIARRTLGHWHPSLQISHFMQRVEKDALLKMLWP